MNGSAIKIRSLIARWLAPRRNINNRAAQPVRPAATDAPASPLFSLGEGPQKLVASYRNVESEQL